MKRYLSHAVTINGDTVPGPVVLTVADDGSVSVAPFSAEIHSTVFVSGTIDVVFGEDGKPRLFNGNTQLEGI